MTRVTVRTILEMKGKEKIAALTAYDYPTAAMLDQAGLDILLVGDSVGNVVYGHENTLAVTMADMLRHTRAVARAAKRALVVGDMPFGSYQASPASAVGNAAAFLARGGAHAVKLEGGRPMEETIRRLVDVGIPVMGHVGFTPQALHQIGIRILGKESAEAERIHQDALAAARAGAFAVVLECVQPELALSITQALPVPTVGIGSGEGCDGQILVLHDLLGLTAGHVPRFVKPMADLKAVITETAQKYVGQVKGRN